MRGRVFGIAIAVGLTACGQPGSDNSAANVAANATANAAAPKRPTYCFFKDAATRGWAASSDASGNVAVKGQVKVDDKRYRGELGQSEVASDTARVWLTMAPNTGYADDDNWWDVTITVPDSGAATGVTVLCGKKEVAKLKIRRG
jgi:hypothetical protein